MKRTRTKVEITVETRRRITLRGQPREPGWCAQCRGDVLLLTPADAAALAGTTTYDMLQRVESGELHFLETADGALFVCCGLLK